MQGETQCRKVTESGTVLWPWDTPTGLAIIVGGGGGGGGGGGALCVEGLNLFGSTGGGGGGGGAATTLKVGAVLFQAAGGNGGNGGDAGSLGNGTPVHGKNGTGCHYGIGGAGGRGAVVAQTKGRLVSNGGDGGRGFPGEVQVVELERLSKGDELEVEIGQNGFGGSGGNGYEKGAAGDVGTIGHVLLIPLYLQKESEQ